MITYNVRRVTILKRLDTLIAYVERQIQEQVAKSSFSRRNELFQMSVCSHVESSRIGSISFPHLTKKKDMRDKASPLLLDLSLPVNPVAGR